MDDVIELKMDDVIELNHTPQQVLDFLDTAITATKLMADYNGIEETRSLLQDAREMVRIVAKHVNPVIIPVPRGGAAN